MLKTYLQIGKVETLKDRALKITAYTPELNPEATAELFHLQSKGEIAAVFQAGESDKKVVEAKTLPKDAKSQAQRLRSTIYLVWKEQRPSMTSDAFYELQMEKYIDHEKAKLPARNF
jgi:hypothetical protein